MRGEWGGKKGRPGEEDKDLRWVSLWVWVSSDKTLLKPGGCWKKTRGSTSKKR